jgi:hypothetical protein
VRLSVAVGFTAAGKRILPIPQSTAHVGVLQSCCASEHSSGHRPRAHSDLSSKRQEENGQQPRCGARFGARVEPIRLKFMSLSNDAFRALGAT